MLSKEQALDIAERQLRTSQRQRLADMAKWALNLAYSSGLQWAWTQDGVPNVHQVRRLGEIIDPTRYDVRVTLDVIRRTVRRTIAATKPDKIQAIVRPQPNSQRAIAAKYVYDEAMAKKLRQMSALKVLQDVGRARVVLGSCGIRRTRRSHIMATLPSAEGRGKVDLRSIDLGCCRVFPWEIIRDPGAMNADPNVEDQCVGQEKPRPVEWVKRNFGVVIKTESTMKQLTNLSTSLGKMTGWDFGVSVQDSEQPAVMVYEFYFQDPDLELPWPHVLLAYKDATDGEGGKLRPLQFGESPFFGLPFHFFHYEPNVVGQWAAGVPQLLKGIQDITNLTMSTAMRALIYHGNPVWLVQDGTLDNPSRDLTNRVDRPIVWKNIGNNAQIPKREPPVQYNPMAFELLTRMKDESRDAANLAGIQFGEMVKRGQSGEAYQVVAEHADAVVNDIRQTDRLEMNEFLMGCAVDLGRSFRREPNRVSAFFGSSFGPKELEAAFGTDPTDVIAAVEVDPNSLRPRTPRQFREEIGSAVKDMVFNDANAKYELYVQGDVSLDTRMAAAIRRQQFEIEQIASGGEPQVSIAEDHATSIRVIEDFVSDIKFTNWEEPQQQMLLAHWAAHKQAKQQIQLFDVMGQQSSSPAGQPSPPAPPEQQPEASGSMGPGINVA